MKKVTPVSKCSLFPAITANMDDDVVSVAKKLHEYQERRVYVVNEKKYPVGIISVVDINDRVVAKNKNLSKTKAKDIMSYPLSLVADCDDSIDDIIRKMINLDNFYCPVVDNGSIKGVLTYASAIQLIKNSK